MQVPDRHYPRMASDTDPFPAAGLVYTPPLFMLGLVLFSMLLFQRADEGRVDLRRIERVRLLSCGRCRTCRTRKRAAAATC